MLKISNSAAFAQTVFAVVNVVDKTIVEQVMKASRRKQYVGI